MRSLAVTAALCGALASAALGQSAEIFQPKLNQRALDKLGWKLSSQAYTFRELTLFETIDVLSKMGIRYIELFPGQRFSKEKPDGFGHWSSPELVAELQAKLAAAKMKPVCYGVVGIPRDEAGARSVFEFARKLGLLNIASEPGEGDFDLLDKLAQEYGINIAIHNHPTPSHYWNPDTVLKVADGRSKRIGACADTGHWYRSGLVPVESLRKLQGRIAAMHFKDLDAGKGDVIWGTGVCDAAGLLAELKRQGWKGVVSAEYERTSGVELINNVARSFQWFSDQATKLAK